MRPIVLLALVLAAPAARSQGCAPGSGCPTLTLAETLARVAAAHPEARSADLERDAAAARLLGARGGFDPLLATGLTGKTDDLDAKLGVWQTQLSLPFDAPFSPSVDLNHRLGIGGSVNPADATSGIGETRLGVSFSPLAGRRTDRRRTTLAQARLAPDAADAAAVQRRNALLLDAARAYWAWAGAWAAVAVRDDLLGAAQQRAGFVARRVRAGEVPPVDSVEARLAVAAREGDRVGALRAAESAGVSLATYLWEADGTPAAPDAAPAPLPPLPAVPDEALRAAAATALARRPELARARLAVETARLEATYAREQLRPDLRVGVQAVSYGSAPAAFDDVYVGVSVRQPLALRPARAGLAQARVDVQRRDLERSVAVRTVEADVERAVVMLRRAGERVALAAEQARLAETLRRAELRRFELGDGTLFLVNQRETALAEAQLRDLDARAEYLQAVAAFAWATGTLGD